MMAQSSIALHDIVFEHIRKYDDESHRILTSNRNRSLKTELTKKIKKIEEVEKQHNEIIKSNNKIDLPPDQLEAVKGGLRDTHKTKLHEEARILEYQTTAQTGRHLETRRIQLDSQANTKRAFFIQLAYVVKDGILLVMAVAGIYVEIKEAAIHSAIKNLAEDLSKHSEVETVVDKFLKAWWQAGDQYTKAESLYNLLSKTHEVCEDIFWKAIKLLFLNMSEMDQLKTALIVLAQLLAAFTTGGLALIGKTILALNSAVEFAKEIRKLEHLYYKMIDTRRQDVQQPQGQPQRLRSQTQQQTTPYCSGCY